MNIGILALQGCIEPHAKMLATLGVSVTYVKAAEDLLKIDRIILPGGESTTMMKLLERNSILEPLKDFIKTHPTWGVCAGSILLAKEVLNPSQVSLGAMNIRAVRNHYGSQRESFKSAINIPKLNKNIEVDFIRAPLLEPLSASVEVLAKRENEAVFLKDGNIIATSFHTELGNDSAMHAYFMSM